MNRKTLLLLGVFYTPTAFADSVTAFNPDDHSDSIRTFYSCESFQPDLAEEQVDANEVEVLDNGVQDDLFNSCHSFSGISQAAPQSEDKKPVVLEDKSTDINLQKLLGDKAYSAMYQALQPQIKKAIWIELRKVLCGTGMVALTADGQELPVVTGSLRGLMDLILMQLGAGNAFRWGVDATSKVTGFKDKIEAHIKTLLRFDNLDAFVEHKSKELTLAALGYAIDGWNNKSSNTFSKSRIANIQQSVALQDGRSAYMSQQAQKGEFDFTLGFIWYEMRNILNTVVEKAIENHLNNLQTAAVQEVKRYTDSFVYGVAGAMAFHGIPGAFTALGAVALYKKYGNDVISFAYQAADQQIINGIVGARDIAAFPISKEDIETYHPVSITVNTREVADYVVVDGVKEESHRVGILTGAASNTLSTAMSATAKAVSKGVSVAGSAVKKIGSWFGF